MRVLDSRFGAVCGYLATVCGLMLIVTHLASQVAGQATVLLTEYLPQSSSAERALSRVEREIEIAQSFRRSSEYASKFEVLTAPALPVRLLAAKMDLAEAADISLTKAVPRRARLASRRTGQRVALSAGEIFGRRFGVLTVASR